MSTTSIARAREVMHARRDAIAAERRKIVDRLYRAGHTRSAIAEQLGVSPVTVRRDLAALGHPLERRSLSAGEREMAARLAADGASISEIARTLRTDRKTIRRLHPEAAYTRAQTLDRIRIHYLERSLK